MPRPVKYFLSERKKPRMFNEALFKEATDFARSKFPLSYDADCERVVRKQFENRDGTLGEYIVEVCHACVKVDQWVDCEEREKCRWDIQ
jgi:hypothetical protein